MSVRVQGRRESRHRDGKILQSREGWRSGDRESTSLSGDERNEPQSGRDARRKGLTAV